jgi:hypothetical protein
MLTPCATSPSQASPAYSPARTGASRFHSPPSRASVGNTGLGIDFVGKTVETASGTRLDVYLQENVLEPFREVPIPDQQV